MTKNYFESMLEEIYSAFGRNCPSESHPVYQSLWRRVNDQVSPIPDEAVQEISYAICEYDSLPMNLGKAIWAEYARWRAKHPERVIRRQACPQCNSGTAGWSYVHDSEGNNYLIRCVCNAMDTDPTAPPAPVATREYLQEHGLTLGKVVNPMDPDGENGKHEYLSPATRAKLVRMLGLGQPRKMRKEHLEQREAAGVYAHDAF